MFHSDIMQAIMQERARDLRREAKAAREAGIVRRAQEYWEERALRTARRLGRRRGLVRPRSAVQTRCASHPEAVRAR